MPGGLICSICSATDHTRSNCPWKDHVICPELAAMAARSAARAGSVGLLERPDRWKANRHAGVESFDGSSELRGTPPGATSSGSR